MPKSLRALLLVPVVVMLACSRPAAQSQQDIDALRKQVEAMQKDLDEIKTFLKAATGGRYGAPSITNSAIDLSGAPVNGSPTAPVTLVEISDYHCPFCRRHFQQAQPQINTEFIGTGKVRHVFLHFPIDQLHPDAYRSHEAAMCANDQGKFWQLHGKLFESPARTADELATRAQEAGLDMTAFRACFDSGRHAAEVRASVQRIQELGVSGTPMFLVGRTPAPGQPFKALSSIDGARPFASFKEAIDKALAAR